jgi:hypothetical protein
MTMECREAQLLLSAAQDREDLHDATAASVAAHCRTCPECGAFDAQLSALNDLGAPRAPEGLAERIASAVAEEAIATQTPAAVRLPVPPLAERRPAPFTLERLRAAGSAEAPAWLTRERLWAGTVAITACAAALVVTVMVAQRTTENSIAKDTARLSEGVGATAAAPPPAGGAAGVAPSAANGAPDYVAYSGGVYVANPTAAVVEPSQLTSIGVVQSALDMGSVQTMPALRSPTDARAIFLVLTDGTQRRFDPVLRLRRGTVYQLQAGVSLARYGEWPGLPSSVQAPTRADGSPTLVAAGVDDAGVTVFSRIGEVPDRGFAIAPGTPSGDPAAGNPNWTWWLPVP